MSESCKNCESCKNEKNMDQMTINFLSSSIKIVVEKECGYAFLIYLNEFSTIIDLYRYIEQFYQHTDMDKILYEDKERNEIIYKTEIKIKDFVNIKNIHKDNELESSYMFYLNII